MSFSLPSLGETSIELMHFSVNSNQIYIMRDDLLPFSFGGSKARIAHSYFEEVRDGEFAAIVSYGGARSNLNRVVANVAARVGISCTVIVPEPVSVAQQHFNYRILAMLGARVIHCSRTNVRQTVHDVLQGYRCQGLRPYYVYGDETGVGNEAAAVRAYDLAYDEIRSYEISAGLSFDFVFHASGTGMTQAGLMVGASRTGSLASVVGISVARELSLATPVIRRAIDSYVRESSLEIDLAPLVFLDQFVFGGYGLYSPDIVATIVEVLKSDGIGLDATYTGKAFLGMCSHLLEMRIRDANVLFVHTGGLPIFFDNVLEEF